ncbi:hypothetical protein FACS1894199_05680 [Bacteroidia bacterium]|nr:hypothetical protein FACS1894199_05680 [Bacteroidia bacterium]
MSNEEQEGIKQRAYAESMRYMSNAKETLQKARKEDNEHAYNVIDHIKPIHVLELPPAKSSVLNKMFTLFF